LAQELEGQVDDRGGAGGAGYQLATGSWRELLRDDCDRQCRPDARLYDDPDFAELKAAGAARSAEMFEERRVAGAAGDGRVELYKSSKFYDADVGRKQHGFPLAEELSV